ncbi:MAG: large conductance mechanosensitive channel protein MscL [Aureispira sp.]
MGLVKEFKEFAIKGNMIDIAVGVIIGAAFNKVVDVLVKEIFLPPLSLLTDGINLESKKIILRQAVEAENIQEVAISYGKLLETGIDFLIVSFTVFMMVKFMNNLRKKAEDPKDSTTPAPKEIEYLKKNNDLLEQQVQLLEKLVEKNNS